MKNSNNIEKNNDLSPFHHAFGFKGLRATRIKDNKVVKTIDYFCKEIPCIEDMILGTRLLFEGEEGNCIDDVEIDLCVGELENGEKVYAGDAIEFKHSKTDEIKIGVILFNFLLGCHLSVKNDVGFTLDSGLDFEGITEARILGNIFECKRQKELDDECKK